MKQEYTIDRDKILSQEELRTLQTLLEKAKELIPQCSEFHVRTDEKTEELYLEGWNEYIRDGEVTQFVVSPDGKTAVETQLVY